MATTAGYEFLRDTLRLSVFPPARPARVKAVTRVVADAHGLAVAPTTDDPLDHLLFALKHEGTNLPILAEALPRLDQKTLWTTLRRSPTGAYIRIACYLWEQFSGRTLEDLPSIGGPTAPLFDPRRYVTAPGARDARWRVRFNPDPAVGAQNTVYPPDFLGRPAIFAVHLLGECRFEQKSLTHQGAFAPRLPQLPYLGSTVWAPLAIAPRSSVPRPFRPRWPRTSWGARKHSHPP